MENQLVAQHEADRPESLTGIVSEGEMAHWTGRWAGGRTRLGRHGEVVWVIERMVRRVPYSITLEAASEREAQADLALFLRDPEAYRTKTRAWAEADAGAVRITAELVGRFLRHLKEQDRAATYLADTKSYLVWWIRALSGRDLRAVTLAELNRALDTAPSRRQRTVALKSFCAWMRARGELRRQEDPTLDLEIPAAVPEKASRSKGHTIDAAIRAYRALDAQVARDVCRVRWATGMHLSEVRKLVARGEVLPMPGYEPIAGVLVFWHKSQREHRQSVDAPTLAAAQRLKERGALPSRNWLQEQLDAAAKAARVPPVALGEMRHSYVTWARTHGEEVKPAPRGVPLSSIASAIGHQSTRTTSRFYDATLVSPMVRVPDLVLVHPEDPRPVAVAVRTRGRE